MVRSRRTAVVALLGLALAAGGFGVLLREAPTQAAESKEPAAGKVLAVTDETFNKEVLQNRQPVLVDFWATWCGPCRKQAPIIEELAKENAGKVKFAKMDVDHSKETPKAYKISAIPTLLLFMNGQVVKQFVGVTSKEEIQAALDEAGK